jgi:CRISPR-associated endonuclease/helicase Cas3
LQQLDGQSVSPKALDEFKKKENITLPFEHNHVLRRRDLLDVCDTAPDLSGNDIDIQRFVRSDDAETDVQVFWRDLGDGPAPDVPAPRREELCNVPIGQAREFLEALAKRKRAAGYVWDHLDERWVELDPRQLRPGLTILLSSVVGGYDWDKETQSGKGWDVDSTAIVEVLPGQVILEEGTGSDPNSALSGPALTIAQHTRNVCGVLDALLESIDLRDEWRVHLAKSATWHDVGKAHAAFQQGLRSANAALDANELWAKSGKKARLKHGRRYFRHELASALAAIQQDFPFAVGYLIAAHHGRVRLAIRALPDEDEPSNPETLFALGVHDGDPLPDVQLDGETCPAITLDLSPMQLGGARSWTANALKLLADLGPFKLAYLEAILRAADLRASQKETQHG